MTIAKRLYAGFGLILGTLFILLLVSLFAAARQSSATKESDQALASVGTIESVRSQIMQNRLNLNNFLLSGDPRDEEKVNKGMTDITDTLKRSESQIGNDALRMALIQVDPPKRAVALRTAAETAALRSTCRGSSSSCSHWVASVFVLLFRPASSITLFNLRAIALSCVIQAAPFGREAQLCRVPISRCPRSCCALS